MTISSTASVKVILNSTLNDTEALGDAVATAALGYTQAMSSGETTNYKVDAQYQTGFVLAASSSTQLDLKSLTDSLGQTISLANAKVILVKNSGYTTSGKTVASAATITIGGTTSPADTFVGFFGDATDKLKVFSGMPLALISSKDGVDVGASTNLVLIENTSVSEAIYVEVLIVGEAD